MPRKPSKNPSESTNRTVELGEPGTSTSVDPEPPIVPVKVSLTYTEDPPDNGEQSKEKPEPETVDHQRHLSSKTDLVQSRDPLMVQTISNEPIDQEYERKLRSRNKLVLVACIVTCCLGNLPIGIIALVMWFLSNRDYNRGQYLSGLGWSYGALALSAFGIIAIIGVWICFLMWIGKGKYPWRPEDAYYT